jgi:hypothetical protein
MHELREFFQLTFVGRQCAHRFITSATLFR